MRTKPTSSARRILRGSNVDSVCELAPGSEVRLLHVFPGFEIKGDGFHLLAEPVHIGDDGLPEGIDHGIRVANHDATNQVEIEKL